METVDVAAELRSFQESATRLSSDPQILADHGGEWVGVFEGEIKASGATLDDVLEALEALGVPSQRSVVRFINPDPSMMLF